MRKFKTHHFHQNFEKEITSKPDPNRVYNVPSCVITFLMRVHVRRELMRQSIQKPTK